MMFIKVHIKGTPEDEVFSSRLPVTELLILSILGQEKMIAPQVARSSKGKIVPQSAYVLLSRLEVRGLVVREDTEIEVSGFLLKRVVYSVTFDRVIDSGDPSYFE